MAENNNAKINEEDVLAIRKMRYEGRSLIDIAEAFKLNNEHVREIVTFHIWRHVKTPYDNFLRKNHRKMSVQQTKHDKFTVEFVRRTFKYDPEDGVLRWNIRGQGIPYGKRAGSFANGHWSVRIFDKRFFTGPLIWFYMTGEWPDQMVDHKDGVKTNDKWSNLRLATRAQNAMNAKVRKDNILGHKGIHQNPNGKFRVTITVDKKTLHLGYVKTLKEAIAVRKAAEQKYHGEFARAQ
jgi:hypothetical protein